MKQVEIGEWTYLGCCIQRNPPHPKLLDKYVIFDLSGDQRTIGTAQTLNEAKQVCKNYRIMKKKHTYKGSIMYRGVYLYVMFQASSSKEAAKIMNTSTYDINRYWYKSAEQIDQFDGVFAWIEHGQILTIKPQLKNEVMPIEKLKREIDFLRDYAHESFRQQ